MPEIRVGWSIAGKAHEVVLRYLPQSCGLKAATSERAVHSVELVEHIGIVLLFNPLSCLTIDELVKPKAQALLDSEEHALNTIARSVCTTEVEHILACGTLYSSVPIAPEISALLIVRARTADHCRVH